MARMNDAGYVLNGNGKATKIRKPERTWFLVKHYGTGKTGAINIGRILFPASKVGKRYRVRVEEVDMDTPLKPKSKSSAESVRERRWFRTRNRLLRLCERLLKGKPRTFLQVKAQIGQILYKFEQADIDLSLIDVFLYPKEIRFNATNTSTELIVRIPLCKEPQPED